MSKLKYIIFTILLFIFSFSYTYADCTKEELSSLSKEADKIMVTYKHLGEVIKEDGSKTYDEFTVSANNLNDDFFVILSPMTDEDFYEEDGKLKLKLTTGTWYYYIYSKKCEDLVKEIKIVLPRFNEYSLDPLCKDVDGEDFPLCGKYYEYEVNRETFERKVKAYRIEKHIGDKKEEPKKENETKIIIEKVLNFIKNNYIYILIAISLIIILIIALAIMNKRKKRKILQ